MIDYNSIKHSYSPNGLKLQGLKTQKKLRATAEKNMEILYFLQNGG
jgi:hypothetical protein